MDREKGRIVIVSRVTEHPDIPERRGIYRYIKHNPHNIRKFSYRNIYIYTKYY